MPFPVNSTVQMTRMFRSDRWLRLIRRRVGSSFRHHTSPPELLIRLDVPLISGKSLTKAFVYPDPIQELLSEEYVSALQKENFLLAIQPPGFSSHYSPALKRWKREHAIKQSRSDSAHDVIDASLELAPSLSISFLVATIIAVK